MNANTAAPAGTPGPARFDARFIEEHRLIERYLERKLPAKGAREVETWCRSNPGYLDGLKLAERAQASLQLLEATGRPVDLSEPAIPWWRTAYVLVGLAILALSSAAALWALHGKVALLRGELQSAQIRLEQGSLQQPATRTDLRIVPDRIADMDKARILLSRTAPQLVDLHIDMAYSMASHFRVIVDKKGQGRALIVNNMITDSNGELRILFNTTGLAAGIYNIRIESLSVVGGASPTPKGWLMLEVH